MAKKYNDGIMTDFGHTIKNGFSIGSNSTGLLSDTLELAREALRPTLAEAREETVETALTAIKNLVGLGMDAEDARDYIVHGRIAS